MVIGLRTRAALKVKKGLVFSSTITIEAIARALLDVAQGTPLEGQTSATREKTDERDAFILTLLPSAGAISLSVPINGSEVTVEANTSTAGPGYHAFLVSALDRVETALGLKWAWDAGDDDTGFVRDRDFAGLQARMAQ